MKRITIKQLILVFVLACPTLLFSNKRSPRGAGARIQKKQTAASHHLMRAQQREFYARGSELLFTQSQAQAYIDQCIASLELVLRPCVQDQELEMITSRIMYTLNQSPALGLWTEDGKFYKKDIIDEYIAGALIEHINKSAYLYAVERTNSHSFACRVVRQIQSDILGVLFLESFLNMEVIAQFMGRSLQHIIDRYAREL